MPRIRLTLEYDGTDFSGWQVQPGKRTVHAEVDAALKRLLGAPVRLEVSGRTDAGVHAAGQAVCFDAARSLPMEAYLRGLNGLLPEDVKVRAAREVAAGFDPRRDARGRRYRYRIVNLAYVPPLRRRSHWAVFTHLEPEPMREAAGCLLGRHDFSAFRAADCQAAHAVRELRRVLLLEPTDDELHLVVEGTAFLKHQVRNIVGSLVEVGRGHRPPEWLAEVLASRKRSLAGPTAPPQGLTLEAVYFDDDPPPSYADPGGGSPVEGPVDGGQEGRAPTKTMDDRGQRTQRMTR